MKRLLLGLAGLTLLLASAPTESAAQGTVSQTGTMVPGHLSIFTANRVIKDAGSADGNGLGIGELLQVNPASPAGTGPDSTHTCFRDAPATGPNHGLCFDASALGGGLISYNAYNGASVLPLQFKVNGITTPAVGTGGNVLGPVSPVPPAGNVVLWNGGTNVKDGGTIRIPLSATKQLYVATTGSDSSNDCTASGVPCLTLQHAVNQYLLNYDGRSNITDINLANGTYSGFTCSGIPVGTAQGSTVPAYLSIVGTNGSANVTIHDTGSAPGAVIATSGCYVLVQGLKVQSDNGSNLFPQFGGQIVTGTDYINGPAALGKFHAESAGVVKVSASYTTIGNAPAEVDGCCGGIIYFPESAITVTLSGTPVYSAGFVNLLSSFAYINSNFVTFSGSATGPRYNLNSNSVVETIAGTATYLPGSTAGVQNAYSFYSPSNPAGNGNLNFGGGGLAAPNVPWSILGSNVGSATVPTITNTNLQLYQGSATNWAGVGADVAGKMYFVTGTSAPATRMIIGTTGASGVSIGSIALPADGNLAVANGIATGGDIVAGGPLNAVGGIQNNAVLAISPTAPTIASGGCSTGSAQSIQASNGTAAFTIKLGGATCGSTIVLTLPTAAKGWVCHAHDITTPASNLVDQTVGDNTNSVTLTNYVRTTGVAGNFTAADVIAVGCTGY